MTTTLTAENIEDILAGDEIVLVFAQPDAPQAAALVEVIVGVKGLDMDEVRSQLASRTR